MYRTHIKLSLFKLRVIKSLRIKSHYKIKILDKLHGKKFDIYNILLIIDINNIISNNNYCFLFSLLVLLNSVRCDSYKILYLTISIVLSHIISKLSFRTILFQTLSILELMLNYYVLHLNNISMNCLIKYNVILIIMHYLPMRNLSIIVHFVQYK